MSKTKLKKAKAILKIVKDDYSPTGKYTVEKRCIDCGRVRMCKPQDAWQVKRCLDCQGSKKAAKLKALITKVKSPQHAADKALAMKLSRLDDWVKRNNEVVESVSRAVKSLEESAKNSQKLRRIWP